MDYAVSHKLLTHAFVSFYDITIVYGVDMKSIDIQVDTRKMGGVESASSHRHIRYIESSVGAIGIGRRLFAF